MIERKEFEDIVFISGTDITLRDLLKAVVDGPGSEKIEIAHVSLGWKKGK